MKRQSSKQSGFTLVEIAIVLVIIGLLLGGVLKGQELITSSKAKALANDIAGVQASFNNYSDRYRALAGDDSQAAVRFTVDQCGGAACVPGTGNGLMAAANNWNMGMALATGVAVAAVPTNATEQLLAWQHLRAAGFLKAGDTNPTAIWSAFSPPRHSAGGRIGVQPGQVYTGQQTTTQSQVFIALENVPTSVAQSLDSSVDDGLVNLGTYRGASNGAAAPFNINPGASYALGVVGGNALPNTTSANVASFNVAAPLF